MRWGPLGLVGFALALIPSKLQTKGEKPGKGTFIFCAKVWYDTKPWFKRGLIESLKGRHANPYTLAFLTTRSDTQAVPKCHCRQMLQGVLRECLAMSRLEGKFCLKDVLG